MKNKMEQVAKILGVELGEEFDIGEYPDYSPYYFTEKGLDRRGFVCSYDNLNYVLNELLTGKLTLKKRPFRPARAEMYFHVNTAGEVGGVLNDHDVFDYACIFLGNCYKTPEEATAHADEWRLKIKDFFEEEGESK